MVRTLYLEKNIVKILDQRLLPSKILYVNCRNHRDVYRCIKDMAVRGAPAIGVAAGYGMYLAAIEKKFKSVPDLQKHLEISGRYLISARPTAVNLSWAVDRMNKVVQKFSGLPTGQAGMPARQRAQAGSQVLDFVKRVKIEANKIYFEDIAINKKIGKNGATLLKKNSTILTHCNAGALATAGWGTALGVIRSASIQKKIKLVYADETRPYLQGARLTAWELSQEKIPHILITDSMAGYFMSKGLIDAVIVGADRIAANGDTANKIGTYSLAVLCSYHKIPFYVAAPVSTFDLSIDSGKKIKIEYRSSDEVVFINKKRMAPHNTEALHPAFDVTPHELITAIVTEKGVVGNPSTERIKKVLGA